MAGFRLPLAGHLSHIDVARRLVIVGSIAILLLPAAFIAEQAFAVTEQDYTAAYLQIVAPAFFEQNLSFGETSHNATFSVSIPAGAVMLNASAEINVSYRFANTSFMGIGTAAHQYEYYGSAVDARADYDNDGYPDLAVATSGGSSSTRGGRIEVFLGGPAALGHAGPDWTVVGNATDDYGYSLAHGDYNGDGIDDLVVGNPRSVGAGSEDDQLLLFFGSNGGFSSVPDAILEWPSVNDTYWGYALAGAVDLDGDSFDDIAVAEPGYVGYLTPSCSPGPGCPWVSGRVSILWGDAGGLNSSRVSYLGLANVSFYFGSVLKGIPDTDSNGADELAVGSPNDVNSKGSAAVFAGAPGNRSPALIWQAIGTLPNERLGSAFAVGTDAGGDGVADLFVGAPRTGIGRVYQYRGTGGGAYDTAWSSVCQPPTGVPTWNFGESLDFLDDPQSSGVPRLLIADSGWYSPPRGQVWLVPVQPFQNATAPLVFGGTSFGSRVFGLGDFVADGQGENDFGVSDILGKNQSWPVGSFTVYAGGSGGLPTGIQLLVGSAVVWGPAGQTVGPQQSPNFAAAIQQYLSDHAAEVLADGKIEVPLIVSLMGGGRLNVNRLFLSYSVVPSPDNVTVAPVHGRKALAIQWQAPPSPDVSIFWLWSNKTGAWQRLSTVVAGNSTGFDYDVGFGEFACYRVTALDGESFVESAPSAASCGRAENPLPPPIPSGVTAAADQAAGTITVNWSGDGTNTETFEIWRSYPGAAAALHWSAGAADRSFLDAFAIRGVLYSYQIRAVSSMGVASSLSEAVAARLTPFSGPARPDQVAVVGDPSGYAATVGWNGSDPEATSFSVNYMVVGDAASQREAGRTAEAFLHVVGLRPSVPYSFWVVAISGDGLQSTPSVIVTVSLQDTVAPAPPRDLAADPIPTGGALSLTWDPPPEPDVARYRIYILDTERSSAFRLAVEVPATATAWVLDGLRNHVTYGVEISAVDAQGNESPRALAVFAEPSIQAPPPPPQVDVVPGNVTASPVELSGLCYPGLWVEVWRDNKVAALTACDDGGRFETLVDLLRGDNLVWARTVDPKSTVRPEWRAGPPTPAFHLWLDGDAPRVIWTSPETGADGVSLSAVLEIAFDEPINSSTLVLALRDADGGSVEGNWSYDTDGQRVVFVPKGTLAARSSYHLEVGASDAAGNRLQLFAFSFRTGSAPRVPHAQQPGEPAGAVALALLAPLAIAATAAWVVHWTRRGRAQR